MSLSDRMEVDEDFGKGVPGGLPYDGVPASTTSSSSVNRRSPSPPSNDRVKNRSRAEMDDLLDRPLGSGPSRNGKTRGSGLATRIYDRKEPVEEDEPREAETELWGNTTGLLGRISEKKVYTMGQGVELLGNAGDDEVDGDDEVYEEPVDYTFLRDVTSDTPIRENALHLSGSPLAHLSTAKMFSYAGLYGIVPIAVEWINDTRLVLLFDDAHSALKAINLIAKTGFEPYADPSTFEPRDLLDPDYDAYATAGAREELTYADDPLELRACHNVPMSLLPTTDVEGRPVTGVDLLAEPEVVNGLVKARNETNDPDLDELAASIPEGLRPGARLDVRWAVESDSAARTTAKESQWYKRYGRNAGKAPENVIAPEEILAEEYDRQRGGGRRVGRGNDRRGGGRNRSRSPSNILGYGRRHRDGEGIDDLGQTADNRSGRDTEIRREDGGGRRSRIADLDRDLELSRQGNRRDASGRDRGGGKRSQADLDRELDDFFASR